ncbi:AAA family ATPase [Lichenicola cladoniae]|uniref:AAA family ATPase n=1 Tax=Lichenicola cladoniae TaxID=1484109 RepID=A0A6M8HV60_9PROT|nr:AAA family ATPase [Lichenicola cladoniae]NPD69432.1 AAA family ATPase [Acetobacteraceae bacterium]QKE92190.1 AAA family ATPase [Lichenicola cladoniae]
MVFGISGVGKTTACQSYVNVHPDYLYQRASTILQTAHGLAAETLRTALPSSVISNQDVLASAITSFKDANPDKNILLDSHAVIDNDVVLIEIPLEIIAALAPDGFILLEADASLIKDRRKKGLRKRPSRMINQIQAEAEAERRVVMSYANSLDRPLVRDTVYYGFDLANAVNQLKAKMAL